MAHVSAERGSGGPSMPSAAALLEAVRAAAEAEGTALAFVCSRLASARLCAAAGAALLLHGVEDEQVDDELLALLRAGTDRPGLPAASARLPCYCAALSLCAAAERLFRRGGSSQPASASAQWDEQEAQPGPAGARAAALEPLLAALPPNPRARSGLRSPFVARFAAQRHVGALNVLRVHMAGIPVVVGTGAGAPLQLHGLAVFAEMDAMQAAGLRPLEVLRAATVNGHAALGLAGSRGAVEAGLCADLVVLREDPSDDIGNMRSVHLVLKDGRLAWARPGSRLTGSSAELWPEFS